MSAQQLESCRLEIEEKGRQVQELVQLLDECNANAVLAFTAPKH